jgi:hypothetical protein
MFSICFTRFFIDTGFEIKPISTEGSILENSLSLISNADIKITLTLGCSSFILVTSSYPFIRGILISDNTRVIVPELCLKNSNACNGSVNPHTAKLYHSNQILIESTIPNSSSIIRMISLFCCLFPVLLNYVLFISLVILLVISLVIFKRFLIRNYGSKAFP